MSDVVLGLDTSNYRTSFAAVSVEGGILMNFRELLPVERGQRGLRQSDAVYQHLKRLKSMTESFRNAISGHRVVAVCASCAPRDRTDSYMPVFEVGDTLGGILSAAMDVPFFRTDHQHGHIRAASAGTPLERAEEYLALHLSGGTTDLLWFRNGTLSQIGGSMDLHIGQLIDRIGVAMGMEFPAGPAMERLAREGNSRSILGCSMEENGLYCHFSGAETKALRLIGEGGISREDLSREVYDLLARTTARMLKAGHGKTGLREALLCGGVASSALFRELLNERIRRGRIPVAVCFGDPGLSGDNAVGAAMIGADRFRREFARENRKGKKENSEDLYGCEHS